MDRVLSFSFPSITRFLEAYYMSMSALGKMETKAEVTHLETPPTSSSPSTLAAVEEDGPSEIHWRTYLIILSSTSSYFGTIAFLTSTSFWLSEITAEVGGQSISLWSSQSYQIIAACAGPFLGSIGDKVGRRWLIIGGLLCGILGCIVGATAKTQNQVIAGSCLFGFLFSVQGQMFAIVSEVLPRRHRGSAQIANNVIGTVGSVVGLFVGAALIKDYPTQTGKYSGWRGMYWFVMGLYVISLVLVGLFYRPPPFPNPKDSSVSERLLDFDFVGSVLFTGAIVPLMMGLVWGGGGAKPWSSAAVVATLVTGCVFLVLIAVHQTIFKKDGLFNHRLFSNRNFALCLAGLFVEGMVYITFNVYYGQLTGVLFETRPLLLASRFSAFNLCTIAISPFIFLYVWRFRRVKELLVGGYVLFIVGVAGLAALTPDQGKVVIFYCAIAGAGFAAPIALLFTVAHLSVPAELLGLASSLLLTFRSLGGALGTAIAGAVYTSKLNTALPTYISSAAANAGLPSSSLAEFVAAMTSGDTATAASVAGSDPAILEAAGRAVLEAYAHAFHYVWHVVLPFLVAATAGCAVIKSIKSEMTDHIDRPAEDLHHHHQLEEKGRSHA